MTTTATMPADPATLQVDVAFCFFSGFLSESSGPGTMFDTIAWNLMKLPMVASSSEVIRKPYSVLPGSLNQFLQLFDKHQFIVPIGHSYGGAAVMYMLDKFHDRGIVDRVPIAVMFDGVPDGLRFGQITPPTQISDGLESARWGVPPDVAAKAVQIYQRVQLIPQGSQIRPLVPAEGESSPRHWNVPAKLIGNPKNNHTDVVYDPLIQDYVITNVTVALAEAVSRLKQGPVIGS